MRKDRQTRKGPKTAKEYYSVLYTLLGLLWFITLLVLGSSLIRLETQDARHLPAVVLLIFLAALTVKLLMSLWFRWWPAREVDLPLKVVHEAMTPERSLALAFCLLAVVSYLNFGAAFNETILNILASVVLLGPMVTYASHVGQLHIALQNEDSEKPTSAGALREDLEKLARKEQALEIRVTSLEQASVWRRLTGRYRKQGRYQ